MLEVAGGEAYDRHHYCDDLSTDAPRRFPRQHPTSTKCGGMEVGRNPGVDQADVETSDSRTKRGKTMKQVIEKKRLHLAKAHIGKEVWIRFGDPDGNIGYQYPHDELISLLKARTPGFSKSQRGKNTGGITGLISAYKYPYLKD